MSKNINISKKRTLFYVISENRFLPILPKIPTFRENNVWNRFEKISKKPLKSLWKNRFLTMTRKYRSLFENIYIRGRAHFKGLYFWPYVQKHQHLKEKGLVLYYLHLEKIEFEITLKKSFLAHDSKISFTFRKYIHSRQSTFLRSLFLNICPKTSLFQRKGRCFMLALKIVFAHIAENTNISRK